MPTTKARPDPKIPDHEVLRLIGGGAYGEVWLARGVTGALRAVKVLWREDFEDDKGFEREFEGILKYEPISRDHPGLVNVLHVGRSEGAQEFYYYVMELGDDIATGSDINPIEYEARTLRSDAKAAGGKPLDTGFCIEVGQRLAEALHHLHELGLAHRDVKPSNVIFVNGKAKLADIGLVAARGQRTFVGTEGFVPPEGPGSAQADVYSLGKVLYEVATGKDRLDFPELPDEIPTGADRRQWLALNQVICEVCDPHLTRRTIRTAGELADAMALLRKGKRRRRRRRPMAGPLTALVLGVGLTWGGWEALHRGPWAEQLGLAAPPVRPAVARPAFLKVTSTPDGADVVELTDEASGSNNLIGRTPTDILECYVGERISLRILRDGYRPYEVSLKVPPSAAEEPLVVSAELQVYAPPAPDEPWRDQLGEDYRPLGEAHESVRPTAEAAWKTYLEKNRRRPDVGQVVEIEDDGRQRRVVATSEAEALAYCHWLVHEGIGQGYLTADHEAIPRFVEDFPRNALGKTGKQQNWRPFRVLVRRIPYGRLEVWSEPPGAEIYLVPTGSAGAEIELDLESQGQAGDEVPLLLGRIPPGKVRLTASLEGYKSATKTVSVGEREHVVVKFRLNPNKSVVITEPWENSLGMRLVPAGKGWMAAQWETRRVDYQAYAEAVGERMPSPADWPFAANGGQDDLHPVVSVSRHEAEAFCRWLTEKEQAEERLTRSLEYRLPTDYEWTLLAGAQEIKGISPAKRDRLKPKVFFWGNNWPPPAVAGNLGEILGFADGFATTAPVGQFPPNAAGMYDLCGNVQEWVGDSYSTLNPKNGLLRGGGWRSSRGQDLYIGSRNPVPPDWVDPTYGFRVVLAKRPSGTGEEPEVTNPLDLPNEEDDGSN
jgi:hypothetical protein